MPAFRWHFYIGVFALLLRGGHAGDTRAEGVAYLEENAKKDGVTTLPSGLQYRILASGDEDGLSPNETQRCEVHFNGSLIDGTEVDSSVKKGKPVKFKPKDAIPGWREALLLMRVGDKWDLTLPTELAYGEAGGGRVIPPGAVLRLEVELLNVDPDKTSVQEIVDNLGERPMMALLLPLCLYFLMKSRGIDPLENFLFLIGQKKKTPVLALKEASKAAGNETVFLDVRIGDKKETKQIQIQLFSDHFPKTTENFKKLCTNKESPSFNGSSFDYAIPGYLIQGGKIKDESGKRLSAFGSDFDTEWSHSISHDREGLVSMFTYKDGKICASDFIVSLKSMPDFDKKYLCFGMVTKGMDVVKQIAGLGSKEGDVKEKITIAGCGEVAKKSKGK